MELLIQQHLGFQLFTHLFLIHQSIVTTNQFLNNHHPVTYMLFSHHVPEYGQTG